MTAFARVLRARVARVLLVCHMTVFVVHDTFLLQTSNELQEDVLDVRLVHLWVSLDKSLEGGVMRC
jgi:hypothetical protein